MMDFTTSNGRRAYIFNDWPTIAAYAYTGYQIYGRGVLILECTPTAPTDNMKFWHEAAAEEAGIGEQVAIYDPEQEIIVAFSFPDNSYEFALFSPDDVDFAPPLMAAHAPPAEELWQDAEDQNE